MPCNRSPTTLPKRVLLKNVGSHLELAFSKYQTLIYIPPLARVV